MISVNVSLIIQMVNFLLLLFIMNLILYRPIRRMVAERNGFIDKQEKGISQANEEATEALKNFEQKIQDARSLGRQRLQELKDQAHDQEKDLIKSASSEAAKQVDEIRERTQREIAEAREQLSGQIEAFSMELAQKILGRSIG